MPLPIEDYALIGDGYTAALIGRNGSIDWLCVPHFDSGACFAALLGKPEHGHWLIAPEGGATESSRSYCGPTLVLETHFITDAGKATVIDFMPPFDKRQDVVRIVRGVEGAVNMCMELIIRFDFGAVVPWMRKQSHSRVATTGPHAMELHSDIPLEGDDAKTTARFQIKAGEEVAFTLGYHYSYEPPPPRLDPRQALDTTLRYWHDWSGRCLYGGEWGEAVQRSLITLKALIFKPTGGIVAAPTTSLPEQWQGPRNWDYRYCWLRDAAFTLNALLLSGYRDEAVAWREWLQRSAGGPQDVKIVYGIRGERLWHESEVPWLPGYFGAQPVRIGNAAANQRQLDVYGELMDTLHLSRRSGLDPEPEAWDIQVNLLSYLSDHWDEPDEGIWEVRGERRHFTHSKVMAWLAFDRAVKDAHTYNLEGPVDSWIATRDQIHQQVCQRGYHPHRRAFTQSYDSEHLDASLLLMPQIGFLPPDDPRFIHTVEAIRKELACDGLLLRYAHDAQVDDLPPGEGAFLPCSFWLADALLLMGRRDEARELFERLLALRNDVGLFSEEYDPSKGRMLGNFPQALTHVAMVNTARLLAKDEAEASELTQLGEMPASNPSVRSA